MISLMGMANDYNEGISTLAPFTPQCVTSVDNGIGDGLVNWKAFHDISREF